MDLQSVEAEPRLQGPVRAVRGGAGDRRPDRRPHHQGPVPARAQSRHLHLPHGQHVLFEAGRARPAQGRDRQAWRLLRLDPCLRHRALHRHLSRAGGAARAQALRRLLGQILARQCRRDHLHPDQGAGHARSGAARGRCRFHRARAADRLDPSSIGVLLHPRHHAEHAHHHLRAQSGAGACVQGRARAPRHQSRHQQAGHRRQDLARLRHAGRRAEPARLCRLRSRARPALRSRRGQGLDDRRRAMPTASR